MIRFDMVCTVERDQGGSDPYGGGEDWHQITDDQRCTWWVASGREATDNQRTVVVADERILVPLDGDVRAGDRIMTVVDRHGNTIFGSNDYREVEHVARQRRFLDCSLRATS